MPAQPKQRERDQNKMDEMGKQCTAYCAYHCDITEIVCEWSLDLNHRLLFWLFMANLVRSKILNHVNEFDCLLMQDCNDGQ